MSTGINGFISSPDGILILRKLCGPSNEIRGLGHPRTPPIKPPGDEKPSSLGLQTLILISPIPCCGFDLKSKARFILLLIKRHKDAGTGGTVVSLLAYKLFFLRMYRNRVVSPINTWG